MYIYFIIFIYYILQNFIIFRFILLYFIILILLYIYQITKSNQTTVLSFYLLNECKSMGVIKNFNFNCQETQNFNQSE